MKRYLVKRLTAGIVAVVMIVVCSILAARNLGSARFLFAPGICIILLCSLAEALFPKSCEQGFWMLLARAVGRGALIGLSAWLVIMFLVSHLGDPGDKFALYVVFFSPGAIILGALAEGCARLIAWRIGRKEVPSP